MVICRVIVFLMTESGLVTSVTLFDLTIWVEPFTWSVCQFVVERAVWRPSGWTELVMNRDIVLWSAVSVRWHCDGSCWLNMKGQNLDLEAEETSSWKRHGLFTRLHSSTWRKKWTLSLSPLWRPENSQKLTRFTSQDKYYLQYIYIYIYIYIFQNKCHCTCTSLCKYWAPANKT
jgi:hypothetical protein